MNELVLYEDEINSLLKCDDRIEEANRCLLKTNNREDHKTMTEHLNNAFMMRNETINNIVNNYNLNSKIRIVQIIPEENKIIYSKV